MISNNGYDWSELMVVEFGNLINDPTQRTAYFNKEVKTRFIKIKLMEGAAGSKVLSVAELGFLKASD
ncbi:discoidin domain-containing protein [Carboxylicivirga sp. N1Y90]|uniref:discoidin domain-containing protein n=1 Tax=Carboxylicivirga fragile TaxID=3417571 RepID=UPI003D338038|nr:discoidin domain-containing protein [Marinilabiliaceae bacterium N1Y90]